MAERYVDDGGDNTTGLSWATAYTSINALISAEASFLTTSGNIVYFGHDMQCQAVNTGNLTITGPSSSYLPVLFISATSGSSPVAYQAGTGNQIDTTEGAYNIDFDGSFYLRGMRLKCGHDIDNSTHGSAESFRADDCYFEFADLGSWEGSGPGHFNNCTFDFSADTGSNGTQVFREGNYRAYMKSCDIVGAGNRTRYVIENVNSGEFIGGDWSSVSSSNELFTGGSVYEVSFSNILTGASWVPIGTNYPYPYPDTCGIVFTNCGPADSPSSLIMRKRVGDLNSSSSIYRSDGAAIESENVSWLITTTSSAREEYPFTLPWIYGTTTAGSKTFDVYITNDGADLDDSDIWLEVQFLNTASEAEWGVATSMRNRPDAATTHTDDTTSTWNGTGPSFTYKQKLSKTVTVGEAGLYRVRVAVGKASIASGDYLYIDPKVTVS